MASGVTFFGLLIIPVLVFLTALPGRFILAPLRKNALNPKPRVQFRMAEILLLTAQAGIAGMLLTGGSNNPEGVVVFVLATIFLGAWWLLGVRWLSHAGVTVPSARLWTLAIAVPLAFGTLPGFLILLSMPVAVSSGGATTMHFLWWQVPMTDATAATIFRVVQISTLVVLFGHIPLCRWIVRRALRTRGETAA